MKTMDLKKSLLFFGIPGMVIYFMFNWVYQPLLKFLPIHWATFICAWAPLLVMLGIVLIKFKKSNIAFKEYFWINKLNKKQTLIAFGALIIVMAAENLLGFTKPILAALPVFNTPDFYPDFFQPEGGEVPLKHMLGISLSGNVYPLFFFLLWLIANIGLEEMLWRGYALPRMEKCFGKWAWLVNGLLWSICIHFFMRWCYIAILPVALITPYFCQKYKSLWPGVIIHGIGNALIYVTLIPAVIN